MEFLIVLVFVAIIAMILAVGYSKRNEISTEETLELTETVPTKVESDNNKPTENVKSELAAKRSRNKGKFVADNPLTEDVNEAFKDGKSPTRKPKKPKNPDLKIGK